MNTVFVSLFIIVLGWIGLAIWIGYGIMTSTRKKGMLKTLQSPEQRPSERSAAPASVFEQVHPAMGDRVRAFALARLGPIADILLRHNRPIHVRCDDSVTRVVAGCELPIRRSRGYAPLPIRGGGLMPRPRLINSFGRVSWRLS